MALLTIGTLAACSADRDGRADSETAHAAAVRVAATGCGDAPVVGGGSFVDDDLVLTVAHVVAGSSSVRITTTAGTDEAAEVVAIDRHKDLAVLRTSAPVDRHLAFGDLRPGSTGVLVVWRDGVAATETFRSEGAVDIHTDDIDDDGPGRRRGHVVQAEIDDGDSGAVLVADGRAVGVVFARSSGRGDRAWAVDVDEAIDLLVTARAATDAVSTGACPHGPDGDADRDDP